MTETERAVRDAIAFGVLASTSAWNGESMGDDQPCTDARLDDLLAQYLTQ